MINFRPLYMNCIEFIADDKQMILKDRQILLKRGDSTHDTSKHMLKKSHICKVQHHIFTRYFADGQPFCNTFLKVHFTYI